jgi:nitrate/TMAO reductase-like tetraheme cytochrome c subunit
MVKIVSIVLVSLTAYLATSSRVAQISEQQDQDEATGLDVAAQMKNCRKCHQNECDEWKTSRHAQSWTSPMVQAAIKDMPDKGDACARCHAPDSILLTGIGKLPKARSEARDLGVTCMACHMDGKKYFGPHASKGHGGIVVEKAFKESVFCSSCHGQPEVNKSHDQYTSFMDGPMATRSSCQECHMPAEERPMVKSKKKLKDVQGDLPCRVHTFEGAYGEENKVEDSVAIEMEFEEDVLKMTIGSRAGHAVPASEGREVRMETTFFGDQEKVLLVEKKVWDYKEKNYISAKGVFLELKAPAGTKKAVAKLDLVMTKVPGRDAEKVMPITKEEASR